MKQIDICGTIYNISLLYQGIKRRMCETGLDIKDSEEITILDDNWRVENEHFICSDQCSEIHKLQNLLK